MTSWRRSLPAYRRLSLPAGPRPGSPSEPERPWVPGATDSAAGEGFPAAALPAPDASGYPPGPGRGTMPVVVSEWEQTEDGDGGVKTRPRLLSVPRAAVTVKDDDPSARERVRRFVEAWRWLVNAREQVETTGLSADESDRYLAGAGVLVRIVPPGTRRPRRRL
jgi:hypothetical protein